MKHLKTAIATAAIGLAIAAAPAGATTTDSCLDKTAPRRCTAQTAETHVTSAIVQMGRYSHGGYTLTCTKAGETSIVARGAIAKGRAVIVQVAGPGRVDCTLRSTARAPDHWAAVKVTLVD